MSEVKEDEKSQSSFGMNCVVKTIQAKWPGVPLVTTAELEKMVRDCNEGTLNLIIYVSLPFITYLLYSSMQPPPSRLQPRSLVETKICAYELNYHIIIHYSQWKPMRHWYES